MHIPGTGSKGRSRGQTGNREEPEDSRALWVHVGDVMRASQMMTGERGSQKKVDTGCSDNSGYDAAPRPFTSTGVAAGPRLGVAALLGGAEAGRVVVGGAAFAVEGEQGPAICGRRWSVLSESSAT